MSRGLPKNFVERLTKKRTPPAGRTFGRKRSEGMNVLESDYATLLEFDPDVLFWKFECIKLRLADNTFYEPDFLVVKADNSLEVHEVKGHWEDDARVKIKVAAETFPFVFVAVTRDRKTKKWKYEQI